MSAVNSLQPPSSPGTERRPYEPSMEEILASIRRIIADDQPLPPIREPEARGLADARVAAPAAHVAEVSLRSVGSEPAAHAVEPRPAAPVHAIADPAAAASHPHGRIEAPQFPGMPEGTVAPPPPDEAGLPEVAGLGPVEEPEPDVAPISTVHDHAYDEPPDDREVDDLAPEPHHGGAGAVYREPPVPEALFSEATDHSVTAAFNALAASRLADNSEELLGIARDMIRPLLKAWIDDNLPSMVERMVRAEIERVARGGR